MNHVVGDQSPLTSRGSECPAEVASAFGWRVAWNLGGTLGRVDASRSAHYHFISL